ncbi:MAG TPA: hypothetical protein VGI58_12790 [Streptosporangiaceae bacterium]
MTSTRTPANPATYRAVAIVLGILGLLALVAGVLYISGAANSIHFMVGSVHKGHHVFRALTAFVVGLILLAGAAFAGRAHPEQAPVKTDAGSKVSS